MLTRRPAAGNEARGRTVRLLYGTLQAAIMRHGGSPEAVAQAMKGRIDMDIPNQPSSNLFKVASTSNPASVAGAIAGTIREKGRCEMQAIGAGAINQAVKAIAIARGYVAPSGIDLVFVPAFLDIQVGGEERTAIKFVIEPRRR